MLLVGLSYMGFSLASGLVASSLFGPSLCLSVLLWVWWVLVFGFLRFCDFCGIAVCDCWYWHFCGFGVICFLLGV